MCSTNMLLFGARLSGAPCSTTPAPCLADVTIYHSPLPFLSTTSWGCSSKWLVSLRHLHIQVFVSNPNNLKFLVNAKYSSKICMWLSPSDLMSRLVCLLLLCLMAPAQHHHTSACHSLLSDILVCWPLMVCIWNYLCTKIASKLRSGMESKSLCDLLLRQQVRWN